MPVTITMPALSPTMEEGNLAKWLVKEGDEVSAGDVIAEIETDKATMEVEAVDEGVVARILVEAGTEGVKVNSAIALLAEEGEDPTSISADDAEAAPAAGGDAGTEEVQAKTEATAGSPDSSEGKAREEGDAPPPSAPQTDGSDGARIFATPLARRIAEQKGVDLASISGSGPRGRIVKADVEAAEAGTATKAAGRPADAPAGGPGVGAPPSGMSDQAVRSLYEEGSFEAKPHDGMRKTIAARLSESSQTIPSYLVTMECDIDPLLALRAQINAGAPVGGDGKPAFKLSVNDFIIKAMARALQAVPDANVSWTSTERLYHKHADVGVAVAIPDGLFTPIVRKAEQKTLSLISSEIKDMAGRARSKKLKPEEYQGGSTAVSNLGMYGVREFTSIINPPHASIVSIGAGEKRAVVRDGELAVATMMIATFAFDHRCIDGALGAELAAAFKSAVENPISMLV